MLYNTEPARTQAGFGDEGGYYDLGSGMTMVTSIIGHMDDQVKIFFTNSPSCPKLGQNVAKQV